MAKKKAEELKKSKGAEKKDAPALPTVEEKSDDMDVDEVGAPEAPAAPPLLAPLLHLGKTATETTEDDKETPALALPQAPDAPAAPAHELPSQVEARSNLGIHDTAGPFAAPRDLHTGQFIYVDCAEEERAMLPATIGSQFEAERALAELRTVNRVVRATLRSTQVGKPLRMAPFPTPSTACRTSIGTSLQ